MNKKDCKILVWGLSTMSLLFLKLPVYASAGNPGDSAREMIRMITIFGLAAAALIIIIIIIAQLRKSRSRRMMDADTNAISEKFERNKEQKNDFNPSGNDSMVNQTEFTGGESVNDFTPQSGDMFDNSDDDSSQDTVVLSSIPKPSEEPKDIMLIEKNTQDKIQVPIAEEIIIGRNSNVSDLVLKGDKAVSGKHCKIIYEDGKFFIEDIGSSNGTYVNQTKIKGKTEIVRGDELVMGRRKYQFQYM